MMNETASKYLLDKKDEINSITVEPRITRFPETKDFIIAVTGPRRSGKTYALYDIIKNKRTIKDEEYIFANFEDVELAGITLLEAKNLVNTHEILYGRRPSYIFFDEVQELKGWEKVVHGFFESKQFHIFISGSSSKMLSMEIASSLRGRSLSYELLPLSFEEFISFHHTPYNLKKLSSTGENTLRRLLDKYLTIGGFPAAVLNPSLADKFYKDYIDVVIIKDVIERHKVRNSSAVRYLAQAALASFGKHVSVHNIFNTAKSAGTAVSKKSLYAYMKYFEEAYFFFLLKKFSFSVKTSELSLPKLYLNDNGIRNAAGSYAPDWGKLYENTVFLQLRRWQSLQPSISLFYYKTPIPEYEVDFVVKDGTKITCLIQVAYTLEDKKTRDRELRALMHASKELKCSNLLIITQDKETEEKLTWFGTTRKIKFVPLWKWLVEGEKENK